MSGTESRPMALPAFEPRFAIRSLIGDRGGVVPRRHRVGLVGPAPPRAELDGVDATLTALDPLIAALALAGYDVREIVAGSSDQGGPVQNGRGYVVLLPRMGAGYGFDGSWAADHHIVDPGTFANVVALRVLSWRLPLDPPLAPVSLRGVAGFQTCRDPDDLDGTADDGWLLLGGPQPLWTSSLVAQQSPAAVAAVAAALQTAMPPVVPQSGGVQPLPGLVRMLDPARWAVPREREVQAYAVRLIGSLFFDRARQPGGVQAMVGHDATTQRFGYFDPANDIGSVLVSGGTFEAELLDDLEAELTARAALLEPLEGSLPTVLAGLRTKHWLHLLMQLHEYGLVDVLPPPSPTPPAIPDVDLTGFYASVTTRHQGLIATLQINQAGPSLRGWWVDRRLELWPFEGTFNPTAPQGRWQYDLLSTADQVGGQLFLESAAGPDVTAFECYVRWDSDPMATWAMCRQQRRAAVAPELVLAGLRRTTTTTVPQSLLLPLHVLHANRIRELGYLIGQQLLAVYQQGLDEADDLIRVMDTEVGDLAEESLLAEPGGDGYLATPLIERTRVEVRQRLAAQSVLGADGWSQLCKLVAAWPGLTLRMQQLLDMIPDQHIYSYTLKGDGGELDVDAGIGLAVGTFTIISRFMHATECAAPARHPVWNDVYHGQVFLGGPSVGLEYGGAVVSGFYEFDTNDVVTRSEWDPDDFRCAFVVGSLAVAGGAYHALGADGGWEAEAYTFFRTRDGEIGTGTGTGWFVQWGMGGKFGAGVSATGQFGWYSSRDGTAEPPPLPPAFEAAPVAEVLGGQRGTAYFERDSSLLNAAAKDAIRELVLTYRALFENASSYLLIEGDASRSGGAGFNHDLSRRRTMAMYDHLHSLLSAPRAGLQHPWCALAVTDSHLVQTPYGESRPAGLKLPDDVEDPDWRRATLMISGRHVASLGAAALLFTPEYQDDPR